jgi:hypothetical protein
MKNLFLALATLFVTSAALAQKITNKDLQGHWNIAAFSASGISYDLKTEEVTLSPEMQAQAGPEAMPAIKEGMKQNAAQFNGAFVDFDGAFMKMAMAGGSETNVYSLTEKDGKQFITVKSKDGIPYDMPVALKDKKLYITVDPVQRVDMVFAR